jgi:itaconate CoA-transferase
MDAVPALGQHTAALLGELGYSTGQVGALRDAGVV